MAQTEALISARLPRVLSAIVINYFRADRRIRSAIAQAGEWEMCTELGYTPRTLDGACIGEHAELIAHLLKLAEPNSSLRSDIHRSFVESIYARRLGSIRALVDAGAIDVDSCLCDACFHNYLELAQFAIEHGATDIKTSMGIACDLDRINLIKLLMANGATQCACGGHDADGSHRR